MSMYNEQLEKLIDYALADGELTEKEKQVLFKKANLWVWIWMNLKWCWMHVWSS